MICRHTDVNCCALQQKAENNCRPEHTAVNNWVKLRCVSTNNVLFIAPDGSKFISTKDIAKFVEVMFGLCSGIESFLLELQGLSFSKEIFDEDLSDLQATIKSHYANLFTEEKYLTASNHKVTNNKKESEKCESQIIDSVTIELNEVQAFNSQHAKDISYKIKDISTFNCSPNLKNLKKESCKMHTINEVSKSGVDDGGALSFSRINGINKKDESLADNFALQHSSNFKIKDPDKSKQRLVRMSPYFKKLHSSKVLIKTGLRGAHTTISYTPTSSPFNLIQERLYMKPWQLLIATIFLNKTSATIALPLFWKFVSRFHTPNDVSENNFEEISVLMKPLGLNNRRAKNIIQFSYEYLHKDWKYPIELYGIGKYGDDSYRMFCLGQLDSVYPTDNKLNLYKVWYSEHIPKI